MWRAGSCAPPRLIFLECVDRRDRSDLTIDLFDRRLRRAKTIARRRHELRVRVDGSKPRIRPARVVFSDGLLELRIASGDQLERGLSFREQLVDLFLVTRAKMRRKREARRDLRVTGNF